MKQFTCREKKMANFENFGEESSSNGFGVEIVQAVDGVEGLTESPVRRTALSGFQEASLAACSSSLPCHSTLHYTHFTLCGGVVNFCARIFCELDASKIMCFYKADLSLMC